ncbi:MAG TPA: L-seryl-tRNA(Sec) selenium transferase [Planktothrix sp.]
MKEGKQAAPERRSLPQVDKILRHPLVDAAASRIRRDILAELTRRRLESYRKNLARGDSSSIPDLDALAASIVADAEALLAGGVRRILNGTGVILNTNLGRAPISPAVVERIAKILPGYCSLEIDLDTGKRGERTAVLQELLSLLTGCQAAIVVNNNAAAVMLAVSALAHGKEVIVSRGELIEIGGSFRLPDVIVSAGGLLREVGTTNRTRADDYRKAIGDSTGLILKCHRSNFAISGFTEETSLADLVKISSETGIPVIEDLGSGALIDLSVVGLKEEPTVSSVLQSGADLVLFSGDKLLGGLQAGIVAGKSAFVDQLRRHPIYRALRADKLVIAILEGVVAQYLQPMPEKSVPLLTMASLAASDIERRAQAVAQRLHPQLKAMRVGVAPVQSAFGGGTLPTELLPSFAVQLSSDAHSSEKLVKILRASEPPVVPIVNDGKVLIDLRTIQIEEESLLIDVLLTLDERLQSDR